MKAGPKAAPRGEPLPLHELPESGPARVSALVETYCRVVKGGTNNPAGELIRPRELTLYFDIWSPARWPRDRHRRLVIAPAEEGCARLQPARVSP